MTINNAFTAGRFTKFICTALLSLCLTACVSNTTPTLNTALGESIVSVPTTSNGKLSDIKLQVTQFTPAGSGPFPLVVINHGKSSKLRPAEQPRYRLEHVAREFLQRGYVVVFPMRKGFAGSQGAYTGTGCDTTKNGYNQAEDIAATIQYYQTQPSIQKDQILVIGQSHGGLSSMALAAQNLEGVRGVINFAGGLRLADRPGCDWQQSLVAAFATYGQKAKIPSLWFYGANDSYWPLNLAKKMHEAYTANGAPAKLIAYGSFAKDSHTLFASPKGVSIWWYEVEQFLTQHSLPTAMSKEMKVNVVNSVGVANEVIAE